MIELKISEVILRERKRLNLTQEELAQALYVSPQAVSNWERGGYPDITLLPSIANFFGISVDELIGNDEVSRQAVSFYSKQALKALKGTSLSEEKKEPFRLLVEKLTGRKK